jgi:translation elongation factor P/translation initiation factor 5A
MLSLDCRTITLSLTLTLTLTAAYSWSDNDNFMFMNVQNYEEIIIPKGDVDQAAFLTAGLEVRQQENTCLSHH